MKSLILKQKSKNQSLSKNDFNTLCDIPPEHEWFVNIHNPNTRRAYRRDIHDFCQTVGLDDISMLRDISRAHVLLWREQLLKRQLAPSSIRRKLSALASLFDYLCDQHAVTHNPVDGVRRPATHASEGKTPALGDAQARKLLEAPPENTLKGLRDRAILATLLFHGIRRQELCKLKVKDRHTREGIMHLRIHGKRDKIRFLPLHPKAQRLIDYYLREAGHEQETDAPLFKPIWNRRTSDTNKHLHPDSIYKYVVKKYAQAIGLQHDIDGLCVHSLRATAATNALQHHAEITKVQEWLGHSDVSTTRLYDRRKSRPEDSPTFRVKYLS